MSERIDREKFLSILDRVTPGLSTRNVVEQAHCYVFKDGHVFTTNDEVACSAEIEVNLHGAVRAASFLQMLSKMKEKNIEIEEDEKEIRLTGKGQRRAGLTKEHEIQLPIDSIEIPKKWKPLPDTFGEAIEFVQDCVSRDEASFPLTCIHITKGFVESFDNHQFARHKIELDVRTDFLVRQPALKSIIHNSMTQFSDGKEWVHFKNEDGLIFSCRRWKNQYLDLTNISKADGHLVNLPTGIIDAAEKAAIMAEGNTEKDQIRVDLEPNKVTISGKSQSGWYVEPKKVKYKGDSFSFMIHPKMFVQILKRETKCKLTDKILRIDFGEKGHGVYVTSLEVPKTKKEKSKKKGKKK